MTTSEVRPRRLSLAYTASGSQLFFPELQLDFDGGPLTIRRVVIDTGLECGILGPEVEVLAALPRLSSRRGHIVGLAGNRRRAQVRNAELTVQSATTGFYETLATEVYTTADPGQSWIVGLPILRRFHLLLADNDPELTSGPWLVAPPLFRSLGARRV